MENQYSAVVTASIAKVIAIRLEEIGAISRRNMYKVTCED